MGASKRATVVAAGPAEESAPSSQEKSRRACLHRQLHKTKFCTYHLKGACHYGTECAFAHSCVELQVTPDLRKTRICKAFLEGKCMDPGCDFAHGEEELISTGLFHKKSLCKWNEKGRCRNGDQCRFAHGTSELRGDMSAAKTRPSSGATAAKIAGASGKKGNPLGNKATSKEPEPMKVLPPTAVNHSAEPAYGTAAAAMAAAAAAGIYPMGMPGWPAAYRTAPNPMQTITALDAWRLRATAEDTVRSKVSVDRLTRDIFNEFEMRLNLSTITAQCTQIADMIHPQANNFLKMQPQTMVTSGLGADSFRDVYSSSFAQPTMSVDRLALQSRLQPSHKQTGLQPFKDLDATPWDSMFGLSSEAVGA